METSLRYDDVKAAEWAHETPRFRTLGFDFTLRTTDPLLGLYLEELFRPFTMAGAPRHVYSLLDRPERSERYSAYYDGEHLVTTRWASTMLRMVLWHINHQTMEETHDHLLVHASAAEYGGAALLFPAAMESGKTTLVAGLVRAGLRYVTDEAVAIEPGSVTITPYPRALSVDTGSWQVLADLQPRLPAELAPYSTTQWQVPANSIRPSAVASRCTPRFVITPRYDPRCPTTLEPLSRAEAVQVLVENTFNFNSFGSEGLRVLGRMVRGCRCFRLSVNDLDAACELVLGLLAEDARGCRP